MFETHDSQPLKPLDMFAFSAIEQARNSFPPQLQNAMAALMGITEPLPISMIAHFATNPEGRNFGNAVVVTEDDVKLMLAVIQAAEKHYGVELLQVESEPEMSYKMTTQFQEYVKNTYPQLHEDVHAMLGDSLFNLVLAEFGEEPYPDEEPAPDKKSTHLLDASTSRLADLVDGAAQQIQGD